MNINELDDPNILFDFVDYIDKLEKENKELQIPSIKVLVEIKFKNEEDDDFHTFCFLTESILQLSGKIRMIDFEERNNLYKLILESYQNHELEKPITGGRVISDGSSFSYKINWGKVQYYDILKDRMPLGFSKIIDLMLSLVNTNNEKTKK